MRVADYVTNKSTGTVHLMSQNPVAVRTLCGQTVSIATHHWGDESASGSGATCAQCKTVFAKLLDIHKAAPGRGDEYHCAVCQQRIKRVPGGQGPTYIHADSGAVVGHGS